MSVHTISVSDKSVISDSDRMSNRLELCHQTSDSMRISFLCRHSLSITVNKGFFVIKKHY